MNTGWIAASPHHAGWLRELAAAFAGAPAPRAHGGAPPVLLTSGGVPAAGRRRVLVVRVGRRPPAVADRNADLWCGGSELEERALRAAGIEVPWRRTGHADVELLWRAPRLRKPRPTAMLVVSTAEPAVLVGHLRALRAALPELDLVVRPSWERLAIGPRSGAGSWLRSLAALSGVVPVPPGVGQLLPTLAQADLLIGDDPEWLDPFLALDRPLVLCGPAAAGLRPRYGDAARHAVATTLPSVVAESLENPRAASDARRRRGSRLAGPSGATARIVTEVRQALQEVVCAPRS